MLQSKMKNRAVEIEDKGMRIVENPAKIRTK